MPPVADAGDDQTVELDSNTNSVSVSFDGSNSYDPDGGTLTYAWSFGDGDEDTEASTGSGTTPSHTYTSAGSYTVELTVTDDENQSDSDTTTVTVKASPVADAGDDQTVELDSNTNSVSVSFNGSNSCDPDGGTLTYEWSFGDGSTGSRATPSHIYTSTGTYTVELTVTDDENNTDSDSITVTVSEPLPLTLTGPDTVIRGDTATYTASIASAGLTLDDTPTFNWKYTSTVRGDRDTVSITEGIDATSQNPQMTTWSGTMVSGGTLEVRTTVNDTEYVKTMDVAVTNRAWGTQVPIATDTTSWGVEAPRSHADLGDVEYDMPFTAADDLDAATVSSGPNKGILYIASLNLTAPFTVKINKHFGMGADDLPTCWVAFKEANTRYAEIEAKVKARLGFDETTSGTLYGNWKNEIHFSDPKAHLEGFMEVPNSLLSDYEDQIVNYVEYIQRSRIAGMDGHTSGWTPSDITINYNYLAADAGDDQTVDVNTVVNFDGSVSCVPAGRTINETTGYSWDFGSDATPATGTGVDPTCTYSTHGEKTVTLTVTDSGGDTDSDTMTVTVQTPPPDDVVANAGSNQTVDINTPVTFDGSASRAPAGRTINETTGYSWDFGSDATPATDTGVKSSCVYSAHGTKTVILTVTDSGGDTDTDTMTVTVKAPPVADAGDDQTVALDSNTNSVSVSFDGSNSYDPDGGTLTYAWNFDDGSTGSGATPSHTYTSTGTYTVELDVTDDENKTESDTVTVTVQNLVANAGEDITIPFVDGGNTISFNASGSYAPSGRTITDYEWNFRDTGSMDNTAETAAASHTYNTPGAYTVELTVTDDQNNVANDSRLVTLFQGTVSTSNNGLARSTSSTSPTTALTPTVTIDYTVEPERTNFTPTSADIEICNSAGTLVKEFNLTNSTANSYTTLWDGSDSNGVPVPDGGYSVVGVVTHQANSHRSAEGTVNVSGSGGKTHVQILDESHSYLAVDTELPESGTSGTTVQSISSPSAALIFYSITLADNLSESDVSGITLEIRTDDSDTNAPSAANAPIKSTSLLDNGVGSRLETNWDGRGGANGYAYGTNYARIRVDVSVVDSNGQTVVIPVYSNPHAIAVYSYPVADAGSDQIVAMKEKYNPAEGRIFTHATVDFDGSNSYDPDDGMNPGDGIDTYEWDFGVEVEKETARSPKPSVNYTEPGEYTVTLTVTDNDPDHPLPKTKSIKVTVVYIEPQTVNDGGSVEFTVLGAPKATAWSWGWHRPLHQTRPAGNNPNVVFTNGNMSTATIAKAHWYAYPDVKCPKRIREEDEHDDNRIVFDMIPCEYVITCDVTLPHGTVTAESELKVDVPWSPGGEVIPGFSNRKSYDFDVNALRYYYTGIGHIKRSVTLHVYVRQSSQFYAKVLEHEKVHMIQFTTGDKTGVDPHDIDKPRLGETYFKLETLKTYLSGKRRSLWAFTPEGLDKKVNEAIRDFISDESDRLATHTGHGVPGESQNSVIEAEAYEVSDKVAPFYLYQRCDYFEI